VGVEPTKPAFYSTYAICGIMADMTKKNTWDKEVMRKYLLDRYYAQRTLFVNVLGGKCNKCGSTDNLEIDHKDPHKKSFELGRLWGEKTIPKALEELKKCQLLCKDCHITKSKIDLRDKANSRYKLTNGADGFRHGTWYAFGTKKCKCNICLIAMRDWYDTRNAKRRKGNGYTPRSIIQVIPQS
jgi:5-methylcytosine-specific restriction endonuclease McrA